MKPSDMTLEEAIEIGKRWLAAGFDLVTGVKVLPPLPELQEDEEFFVVRVWEGIVYAKCYDYPNNYAANTWIPDVRDPGVIGKGMAQLREKLGEDVYLEASDPTASPHGDGFRWQVRRPYYKRQGGRQPPLTDEIVSTYAMTDAEAVAVAFEAVKAREVEG